MLNLSRFKITRLIAQWIEHQIPILGVEGSIPSLPYFNAFLESYINSWLHLAGLEPATSLWEADYESDAFDHLATDAFGAGGIWTHVYLFFE